MKHKLMRAFTILPYVLIIVATIMLVILHKFDHNAKYNIALGVSWMVLCLIVILFIFYSDFLRIARHVRHVFRAEDTALFIVVLSAITTRFLLLGLYPYVTVGDELRDAGLHALHMRYAPPVDVFAFGSYEGYGNVIPFISYLFSFIFSTTRYSYIVPAAITGILSIIATYILGRKAGGKMVGFVAAIFLTLSIHHLHYSRTELLVILDSLLSPLLILATYYATKHRHGYLLFGLLAGSLIHFYAGARGIAVACGLYLLCHNLMQGIDFKKHIIIGAMFLIGFATGVGPTYNLLSQNNVVTHTGKTGLVFNKFEFVTKTPAQKFYYLVRLYERSFLVYFANPLGSHLTYPDNALQQFPMNWLFIGGCAFLIIKIRKLNSISTIILICLFVVPFTNQLLLDDPGSDHRLMSITPVLAIIASFGFVAVVREYLPRHTQVILTGMLICFIAISQLFTYFYLRPSDNLYEGGGLKEYQLQAIVNYVKDRPNDRAYFLLNNAPHEYNMPHYHEKMEYLLYPQVMTLVSADDVKDVEEFRIREGRPVSIIYIDPIQPLSERTHDTISKSCQSSFLIPRYGCPIGWTTDYAFYIANID